jgi:hypothetical protein
LSKITRLRDSFQYSYYFEAEVGFIALKIAGLTLSCVPLPTSLNQSNEVPQIEPENNEPDMSFYH